MTLGFKFFLLILVGLVGFKTGYSSDLGDPEKKEKMPTVSAFNTNEGERTTSGGDYSITQSWTQRGIGNTSSITINMDSSSPAPRKVIGGVYVPDTISIVEAIYGGTGILSRPGYAPPSVIKSHLVERCEGISKCSFLVDNTLNDGTDPCWLAKKSLTVTYRCSNKASSDFARKETVSFKEGGFADLNCTDGHTYRK